MTALPDFIPGTKFRAKISGEIICPRKVSDAWPDAYASQIKGDCLAPEIEDGDWIIASPSAPLRCGDYGVIYRKEGGPSVKRLVIIPDPDLWNAHLAPGSEIVAVLVVEMTNPPKALFISCDKLDAVHAVVHYQKEADPR